MKPVNKGANAGPFKEHGHAKPELIARLGGFCSYCERQGDPQDLHVEHIYPKDPHPELELIWANFLLACNTCNSYKNGAQGNGRQRLLLNRSFWPHRHNTANVFKYDEFGRVTISTALNAAQQALAAETLRLIGLDKTPASAASFHARGIAYDSTSKRKEAWGIAERARDLYHGNPTKPQLDSIMDTASRTGFFSIWMAVFAGDTAVRLELIRVFKACTACFHPVTSVTIPRRRV